jgi:hypothetical protein
MARPMPDWATFLGALGLACLVSGVLGAAVIAALEQWGERD